MGSVKGKKIKRKEFKIWNPNQTQPTLTSQNAINGQK